MKCEPTKPRLLRTKEAAKYLAMSPGRLRKLARDGRIPVMIEQDSSVWKFLVSALDQYITDNMQILV